jgi:hypothetical protein
MPLLAMLLLLPLPLPLPLPGLLPIRPKPPPRPISRCRICGGPRSRRPKQTFCCSVSQGNSG